MLYKKILVALENSPYDQFLIPHVKELAKIHHSHLFLVHVADGWVARNYNQLQLTESEEMKKDQLYLQKIAEGLLTEGIETSTQLALGDPSQEIIKLAVKEKCDLIALTSHGHRFVTSLFLGSTIEEVRHQALIPLLIIDGKHAL